MESEYLIVLNYCSGQVMYRELTDEDRYISETFGSGTLLRKYGLDEDECSWLLVDEKPVLEYLDDIFIDPPIEN